MKNNLLFYCLGVIVLYLAIVFVKDKNEDKKDDNKKNVDTQGVERDPDEGKNSDHPVAPENTQEEYEEKQNENKDPTHGGGHLDGQSGSALQPQPAPAPTV